MQKYVAIAAILGGLVSSGSALADTVIFSDDFESYNPYLSGSQPSQDLGLNYVNFAPNWSVPSGTVDLIGHYSGTEGGGPVDNYYNIVTSNHTQFIDLDGSSNHAGTLLSMDINQDPANSSGSYKLTFDLAGNLRGAGSDSVTLMVTIGGVGYTITTADTDDFASHTIWFHASGADPQIQLSFAESGTDDQGQLLDNVVVSSVPLPGGVWSGGVTLAGLGAFGVIRRRALRKS